MPIKFNAKMLGSTHSPIEAGKKVKAEAEGKGEDHEPAFVIKDFRENYLTYHIHRKTAGNRKARHHNRVHISDLDPDRHWCPREAALLTMHEKKRPDEFLSTAQALVFRFGNKGADLVIESLPPEMVWGHWDCPNCGSELKFTYTPDGCPTCEHDSMRYREVFMQDPATGVVGSVDLFVDLLGNGKRTGVEIKTEGGDGFGKRIKASLGHEWRSKGYLYLMARDPHLKDKGLNTHDFRIMYVNKEGYKDQPKIKEWGLADWAKSPLKEYWVERDDNAVEHRIGMAQLYRDWRKSWDMHKENPNVMPLMTPDRIPKCTSYGCSRAKNCSVRKQCWK